MIPTFCASIKHFAREHIDARRIDQEHRIPPGLLEGLSELGVFGTTIPETFGGAELGLPGACAVVATLARFDRSVATTVGLHLGLGSRGLVAYGSSALQERWLPELATGKRIAAFATTEAGAGSDLAAIRTQAVPQEGGLRVDGEKIFVTNGGIAGLYTITASTPGLGGARRGHSLLLLCREDEGVKPGVEEEKLGLRGSSTTSLYLDAAKIPMERVIGVPGEGMNQLGHVLAWGRTVMAAGCVGTAAAALAAAVEHTAQRKQFGRRLADFPVVQDQLADMASLHFAMEALVEQCSRDPRLPALSLAAKILCSEGAGELVDTALQLLGGSGYIEESGMPLLLRDTRITRIFEGANDVLRVHLGLMNTVAWDRKPLGGRHPLGRQADLFHDQLEESRQELSRAFGIRLAREQRLLHRLGQLALLREAGDAAVLRAIHLGSAEAAKLAAGWLDQAQRRGGPLRVALEAPSRIRRSDDVLKIGVFQE